MFESYWIFDFRPFTDRLGVGPVRPVGPRPTWVHRKETGKEEGPVEWSVNGCVGRRKDPRDYRGVSMVHPVKDGRVLRVGMVFPSAP